MTRAWSCLVNDKRTLHTGPCRFPVSSGSWTTRSPTLVPMTTAINPRPTAVRLPFGHLELQHGPTGLGRQRAQSCVLPGTQTPPHHKGPRGQVRQASASHRRPSGLPSAPLLLFQTLRTISDPPAEAALFPSLKQPISRLDPLLPCFSLGQSLPRSSSPALNFQFSCLSFPVSWDDRYAPPGPAHLPS